MPDVNPLFDSGALDEMLGTAAPASAPSQSVNPLLSATPEAREQRQLPVSQYKEMPAAEVARRAIEATPKSFVGAVKSTVEPFYPENIPETAMNIGQLAAGAVSKGVGALGFEQDKAEKAKTEAVINQVMQHYGEKYGSTEGFKKAVAEDPMSVLADVSSALTLGGGAAARAPGMLGTVGKLARTTGEVTGPISGPVKVAGKAAELISPLANVALSGLSGTSVQSLNEAAKAGITGNPVFWKSMAGDISPEQVVSSVRKSLSDIAKERSDQYVSGMSSLDATKPLSYKSVEDAIKDAKSVAYHGPSGLVKNKKAAEAIKAVSYTHLTLPTNREV